MQDWIQFGDKKIEFSVTFKKRKTIGLIVQREGGLKVSAPKWVSKKQVREVVLQKAEWILEKLSEFEGRPLEASLQTDGELFFLGEIHRLKIIKESYQKKIKVFQSEGRIVISLPPELEPAKEQSRMKEKLIAWFRQQAEDIMLSRVKSLSLVIGVLPEKITIRQQKTRWGSCSSKGNLNLNWRLVMMPIAVMDYVLIHELVHLKYLNHSKIFWQEVEKYLPDYKERKLSLKQWGKIIQL